MAKRILAEAPQLECIYVPAALRSIISENKLAANDIALLLLIIERTLQNVSPAKSSTALSIRHIAELNCCSDKGAENSVKKLKGMELITQTVFRGTMRPSEMALTFKTFAVSSSRYPTAAPSTEQTADNDVIPDRERGQQEISEVRELLLHAINSGSKAREADLPDFFLAALFLDHFNSPAAVSDYLQRLHSGAKRRKLPIRGYGFYHHAINRLRDAEVYKRHLDSIPQTIPIQMPAPKTGSNARAPKRLSISVEDWNFDDHDNIDPVAATLAEP